MTTAVAALTAISRMNPGRGCWPNTPKTRAKTGYVPGRAVPCTEPAAAQAPRNSAFWSRNQSSST